MKWLDQGFSSSSNDSLALVLIFLNTSSATVATSYTLRTEAMKALEEKLINFVATALAQLNHMQQVCCLGSSIYKYYCDS
jgi:hypothetical protein